MKLLTKTKYKEIENILYKYNKEYKKNILITKSITEVLEFFNSSPPHLYFLDMYYFKREKYKNRYPDNSALFKKLCRDLYIVESTGYDVKRELIYKIAMVFYKNGVIK